MGHEALKEVRCTNCGKLMFKADIRDGVIQRKCVCGTVNTLQNKKPESRPYQDRLHLMKK